MQAGGGTTLRTSRARLLLLINHPGKGSKMLRQKEKRGNLQNTFSKTKFSKRLVGTQEGSGMIRIYWLQAHEQKSQPTQFALKESALDPGLALQCGFSKKNGCYQGVKEMMELHLDQGRLARERRVNKNNAGGYQSHMLHPDRL